MEAARQAIEDSMAGALKKAQVPRSAVLSVCLAAAGIDRQSDIDSYRTWLRCGGLHSQESHLYICFCVLHLSFISFLVLAYQFVRRIDPLRKENMILIQVPTWTIFEIFFSGLHLPSRSPWLCIGVMVSIVVCEGLGGIIMMNDSLLL